MLNTLKVATRKKTSALKRHSSQQTHNELVEAARAVAGLWTKRPVSRTQLKQHRKRLGYL